jgi:hypothetical protein
MGSPPASVRVVVAVATAMAAVDQLGAAAAENVPPGADNGYGYEDGEGEPFVPIFKRHEYEAEVYTNGVAYNTRIPVNPPIEWQAGVRYDFYFSSVSNIAQGALKIDPQTSIVTVAKPDLLDFALLDSAGCTSIASEAACAAAYCLWKDGGVVRGYCSTASRPRGSPCL